MCCSTTVNNLLWNWWFPFVSQLLTSKSFSSGCWILTCLKIWTANVTFLHGFVTNSYKQLLAKISFSVPSVLPDELFKSCSFSRRVSQPTTDLTLFVSTRREFTCAFTSIESTPCIQYTETSDHWIRPTYKLLTLNSTTYTYGKWRVIPAAIYLQGQ